jgi:vacuolar-type H+-ATPase subunit I/STV1
LINRCPNQPDEAKMNDQQQGAKAKKTTKSLDEEIAATREKLRKLEEQKKEKERKELERNQKAITAFLRAEKLDAVPVELWAAALPGLRKLFKLQEPKEAKSVEGARPGAQAEPAAKKESAPSAPAAGKPAGQGDTEQAAAPASVPEPA